MSAQRLGAGLARDVPLGSHCVLARVQSAKFDPFFSPRVAEQLLHVAQVRVRLQEVRRARVPPHVARDDGFHAGRARVAAHDFVQARFVERFAPGV